MSYSKAKKALSRFLSVTVSVTTTLWLLAPAFVGGFVPTASAATILDGAVITGMTSGRCARHCSSSVAHPESSANSSRCKGSNDADKRPPRNHMANTSCTLHSPRAAINLPAPPYAGFSA